MPTTRPRSGLNAQSWVEAALNALARGGVERVRVELLAKALKVTKGSFYWHFRDREGLLDAVLARWREGRIEAIRAQAAKGPSALAALLDLLDLYLKRRNPRGMAIELAIRDWARRDPKAEAAVAAVDSERLAVVSGLFHATGLEAAEAEVRALTFYAFVFGHSLMAGTGPFLAGEQRRAICLDVLLGDKLARKAAAAADTQPNTV